MGLSIVASWKREHSEAWQLGAPTATLSCVSSLTGTRWHRGGDWRVDLSIGLTASPILTEPCVCSKAKSGDKLRLSRIIWG